MTMWQKPEQVKMQSPYKAVAIWALVISSSWLIAQESTCEAALQPLVGSQFGYKQRGNRCEGLYVANVGARAIEIVSFTEGEIRYSVESESSLSVKVRGVKIVAHVRAVAKPLKTYYRMDTTIAPGGIFRWPVSDVLRPQKLTQDRIGIFAWIVQGDEDIFLPVEVSGNSPKALNTFPILSLRPTFQVSRLRWRASPLKGNKCDVFPGWQAFPRKVMAGQIANLQLRALKGYQCLDVAAETEMSNQWHTLQIRMFIPE